MTSAPPPPSAFQVHASDNVATLLADAAAGATVLIVGPGSKSELPAREKIAMGHKIALTAITEGASITKFGVVIGIAMRPIEPGEWVHLHNCRSQLDERSGSFDLETGAPPIKTIDDDEGGPGPSPLGTGDTTNPNRTNHDPRPRTHDPRPTPHDPRTANHGPRPTAHEHH
jgi:altronate dehydratase small subunit